MVSESINLGSNPSSPSKTIDDLLLAGYTYSQIITELGVAKSTISYRKNLLSNKSLIKPSTKLVDWPEVNKYLITHTLAQTKQQFNLSSHSFYKAVRDGVIDYIVNDSASLKAEEYCQKINGKKVDNEIIKKKLIAEGKEEKCDHERCGRTEWNGEKIPLQLDHINGDRKNNLLTNLRFLCPNCHAQTPTWGSKKRVTRD